MKELSKYIDHTQLKANATEFDISKLCVEAIQNNFYAVCVNSRFVYLCKQELEGSDVKIAAVVGFPLGAMATEIKAAEAEYAARNGADEIDMVIPVGLLKQGSVDAVYEDIKAVVLAAAKHGAIVKVILETCELTDDEIVMGCKLSAEAGAKFVKTSTGFGSAGATIHHVKLMKESIPEGMMVKAAGGIRDRQTALAMIEAGADRIGASAGIAICKED